MEKTIVPPYSNTGVREYINNINEYQFGTFHPEEKISYSIDWLRVTTGKIEYSKTQEPSINGILKINKLLKLLKTDYDFYSLKIENYGINGYRYKMTVCDGIKLYFYGPCNKLGEFTTLIEITGTGSDRFRSSIDWYNLIKFYIEELKVNCTRIDMAVDDFYGENITYKEFFNIVNKEFYKRCGTPKSKPVWYTESLNNYDDGCTVNFYSPTSNVQLVSYNKQAEQKGQRDGYEDIRQGNGREFLQKFILFIIPHYF